MFPGVLFITVIWTQKERCRGGNPLCGGVDLCRNRRRKTRNSEFTGMHCATCAATVEEALSNVKDVSKAQVNFGTDTARVEFDPSKVSIRDLEQAVRGAGYEVANREVVIRVGGMMCATCVQTIEAALRALPGVVSANVNLGNEQAYVTYNPSLSAVADMKRAIGDAGYRVSRHRRGDER